MKYETEEQQLEAIKDWWKQNANMIIGGVAIGISAIFGWQYYQDQTIVSQSNASVIYQQVMNTSQSTDSLNEQQTRVNQLQADYANTPYASLAALLLAKQHMAAAEFEKAQQQLEWVASNATQDEIQYLAKIRLAKLFFSVQQLDKALEVLNQDFPSAFQAMALELKGDVLLMKGDKPSAQQAYQQALMVSDSPSRLLMSKIDEATPAEATTSTAADA
ncbi:MAG TPA: tetratricopeptide repeat protein [Gammaproteobacteria bacterium]